MVPWLAKLAAALKDIAGLGSVVGYTQLVFGVFFAFGAFVPLIFLGPRSFAVTDHLPRCRWSDGG
ncbi:hypothetical protein BST14_18340 [Mycobacterium arosiense ATCC BAA-1401 = DSM 45069]|uniref:Uncharacterized protein n=1 Tax=Mycobacterium arosiense ATCC BAA-1401 = DSM 45069 TaxID=1265311 RepID=A0A1W9ZC96_MYCAI|nr:hypothetical protein BST14_18340 [Mycobacterium arosiense ATCC BAA-1401 = DSM 45069]